MIYPPFKLTAYSVWLRCMPCEDAQTQKTFWADIVLFVKAHPGKSKFFEELVKKVCLQDEAQEFIKLPLPLLVDNLMQSQAFFDDELWSEVICEWTKLNLDLKIKTQTLILQEDGLITKFLQAVLGKSKNPRPLIRQIAKASGLLKDYSKNDVIMMLCSIVAESLKYQMEMKENGGFMQKGVFHLEEEADASVAAREELLAAEPVQAPAQCSFAPAAKGKELQTLWDMFLSELAEISPLDECWQDTELYAGEVQDIAAKKIKECEEIVKRQKLTKDFTDKAVYISDVFRIQLNEFAISVPEGSMAESFDNVCLEHCIEIMTKLQQVLQKYKELSTVKKASLTEEKKRIGQIFTVMTDIENLVEQLHEACPAKDMPQVAKPALAESDLAAEPQQVEEENTAHPSLAIVTDSEAEAETLPELAEKQTTVDEEEEQIELFLGK